jgi:hypothetical protein
MQSLPPDTPPRLRMIRRIARAFFPEKREKPRNGADKTVLLLAAMALSTIAEKAKSEDILVAPIETRVNKEINTSSLTDRWINAIRQMYNWMYNGTERATL